MKKNLLYAALCAAVLSAGSLAVHAEGDPAAAVPAVVYGADENETPIIPAEEKKVGLVIEDGVPYVYGEDGELIRNATPVINGKKYYVNGEGIAQYGWLRLANWQMYFDKDTYEAATGITHVDGKAYLFDENGVEILMSRTEVINGKKYWFQPDGSLMSGWCILGDWTMYYDPETYVGAAGLTWIDGMPYVFDENGVLMKNATPNVFGAKYYVNGEGIAQSGWLKLADWQMYFDPETYQAATGITHVDGKAYLFDENGVEILKSRTEVINGKKYWFQPDGTLMSGWCDLGDWQMYFDPVTYEAAVGYKYIDSDEYYFDENGVLIRYARYISYKKRNWYCVEGNRDTLIVTKAPECYGQTGMIEIETDDWIFELEAGSDGVARLEYEDEYGNRGFLNVHFELDYIYFEVTEYYHTPNAPYSPDVVKLNGRVYYSEDLFE